MKNAKSLGILFALLLGLYIGSYLALSVAGRTSRRHGGWIM